MALTDMGGAVVERFQYTPEGQLVYRSGTTNTPFLYLGQHGVMTESSGLIYMRARYYNPAMGRFINEDPFEGRYDDLLNLNLYAYCSNNPVMFIDPSGNIAITNKYEDSTFDGIPPDVIPPDNNKAVRNPDYYAISINIGIKSDILGSIFSYSNQVTIDCYGNMYLASIGEGAGTSTKIFAFSTTAGWLDQDNKK